jgi:biopolymer transport protein ExbD
MSFATPPRGAGGGGSTSDYGWRPPTTMLDVLFLILAFFVTIAAFRDDDRQINVALPTQQAAAAGSGARTQIVITVTRDEKIYMGDRVYTLESLRTTLGELAKQYPNESVVIRGDRESRLGMAVKVMDAAYESKLRNVYLATTKPRAEVGK